MANAAADRERASALQKATEHEAKQNAAKDRQAEDEKIHRHRMETDEAYARPHKEKEKRDALIKKDEERKKQWDDTHGGGLAPSNKNYRGRTKPIQLMPSTETLPPIPVATWHVPPTQGTSSVYAYAKDRGFENNLPGFRVRMSENETVPYPTYLNAKTPIGGFFMDKPIPASQFDIQVDIRDPITAELPRLDLPSGRYQTVTPDGAQSSQVDTMPYAAEVQNIYLQNPQTPAPVLDKYVAEVNVKAAEEKQENDEQKKAWEIAAAQHNQAGVVQELKTQLQPLAYDSVAIGTHFDRVLSKATPEQKRDLALMYGKDFAPHLDEINRAVHEYMNKNRDKMGFTDEDEKLYSGLLGDEMLAFRLSALASGEDKSMKQFMDQITPHYQWRPTPEGKAYQEAVDKEKKNTKERKLPGVIPKKPKKQFALSVTATHKNSYAAALKGILPGPAMDGLFRRLHAHQMYSKDQRQINRMEQLFHELGSPEQKTSAMAMSTLNRVLQTVDTNEYNLYTNTWVGIQPVLKGQGVLGEQYAQSVNDLFDAQHIRLFPDMDAEQTVESQDNLNADSPYLPQMNPAFTAGYKLDQRSATGMKGIMENKEEESSVVHIKNYVQSLRNLDAIRSTFHRAVHGDHTLGGRPFDMVELRTLEEALQNREAELKVAAENSKANIQQMQNPADSYILNEVEMDPHDEHLANTSQSELRELKESGHENMIMDEVVATSSKDVSVGYLAASPNTKKRLFSLMDKPSQRLALNSEIDFLMQKLLTGSASASLGGDESSAQLAKQIRMKRSELLLLEQTQY